MYFDLGVNPVRNNSESSVYPDARSSMGSFFSSSIQESNAKTRRAADTEIRSMGSFFSSSTQESNSKTRRAADTKTRRAADTEIRSMGSFFSSSTQESNAKTRRAADTEIRREADTETRRAAYADSCRRQQLFPEPHNDVPTDSFGWRDDHFPTFQQVDQLRQRFLEDWFYHAITSPVSNQILLNKFKGDYLDLCKADPEFNLKDALKRKHKRTKYLYGRIDFFEYNCRERSRVTIKNPIQQRFKDKKTFNEILDELKRIKFESKDQIINKQINDLRLVIYWTRSEENKEEGVYTSGRTRRRFHQLKSEIIACPTSYKNTHCLRTMGMKIGDINFKFENKGPDIVRTLVRIVDCSTLQCVVIEN